MIGKSIYKNFDQEVEEESVNSSIIGFGLGNRGPLDHDVISESSNLQNKSKKQRKLTKDSQISSRNSKNNSKRFSNNSKLQNSNSNKFAQILETDGSYQDNNLLTLTNDFMISVISNQNDKTLDDMKSPQK